MRLRIQQIPCVTISKRPSSVRVCGDVRANARPYERQLRSVAAKAIEAPAEGTTAAGTLVLGFERSAHPGSSSCPC